VEHFFIFQNMDKEKAYKCTISFRCKDLFIDLGLKNYSSTLWISNITQRIKTGKLAETCNNMKCSESLELDHYFSTAWYPK